MNFQKYVRWPGFLEMTPHKFYILWKWLPIRLLWKLQIFWLQIMPNFNAYFICSRVYKIGLYKLQLLHFMSVHVWYCFVLPSWIFFKWSPPCNARYLIWKLPPKTNLDFENDPTAPHPFPTKWPALTLTLTLPQRQSMTSPYMMFLGLIILIK